MGIGLVILGLNIESELDKGWTCSKVESLQCFKWVGDFLSHDISSHEAFSLYLDHNHNPNPYPNRLTLTPTYTLTQTLTLNLS